MSWRISYSNELSLVRPKLGAMKLLILIPTTRCHKVIQYLFKYAQKVKVLTDLFQICYKYSSLRKLGQEHWHIEHKTVNSCKYVLGGGWGGDVKNILVLIINAVRLEIKFLFLLIKVCIILQKGNFFIVLLISSHIKQIFGVQY